MRMALVAMGIAVGIAMAHVAMDKRPRRLEPTRMGKVLSFWERRSMW